jgi:hypothetical protein
MSKVENSGVKNKAEHLASCVLTIGLLSGAGYGIFEGLDAVGHAVIGSYGPEVPEQTARAEAVAHYDQAFRAASPAGKFIIEYLRKTASSITQYPEANGFMGTIVDGNVWQINFNNGCLYDTAYDIAGGAIHASISGLFTQGSASGNIPTAAAFAEINPNNPNELIVESGNSDPVNLVFTGLNHGDSLTPANSQTSNILKTYGCKEGVIGVGVVNTYNN